MPYEKLKEKLFGMFIYFEKDYETKKGKILFGFYLDALKEYDEETVCKRIQVLSHSSKFMPKIADITDYARPNVESEMERDWAIFRDTRCNNYAIRPMADWVYTIKKHIGAQRCEDTLENEIQWLKKEFEKAYVLLKNGFLELQESPRYLQIDGCCVPESEKASMTGKLLESYKKGEYKQIASEHSWQPLRIGEATDETKSIEQADGDTRESVRGKGNIEDVGSILRSRYQDQDITGSGRESD